MGQAHSVYILAYSSHLCKNMPMLFLKVATTVIIASTTGTLCPLGPKAAFAPQDARMDRPLGGVIGWFDAFNAYERPQCLVHLEDLPTDPFGVGHATGLPSLSSRATSRCEFGRITIPKRICVSIPSRTPYPSVQTAS